MAYSTTVVYRVLRENEVDTYRTHGLRARNPGANVSVEEHVLKGSYSSTGSQYISVCASLEAAQKFVIKSYRRPKTIVRINLSGLDLQIVDLSTYHDAIDHLEDQKAINFSLYCEEMLLVGHVPASNIQFVQRVD